MNKLTLFSAAALLFSTAAFAQKNKKQKAKPKWTKTDHEFLEEEILKRFRRTLGDTLLHKGLITSLDLHTALNDSQRSGEKLGEHLIRTGVVSERNVLISLCEINQKTYVDLAPEMVNDDFIQRYSLERLKELKMLPLLLSSQEAIVVTLLDQDVENIKKVIGREQVQFLYTTETLLLDALNAFKMDSRYFHSMKKVEGYVEQDKIKMEQGLIALLHLKNEQKVDSILYTMGLLQETGKVV